MKRQPYQTVIATTQQRTVAARPLHAHSEVLVPTMQALISGLFAGLLALVSWKMIGGDRLFDVFLGVAVGVAAPLWFVFLVKRWSLLADVQEHTVEEEPQQVQIQAPPVRLEMLAEAGHVIRNVDLEATDSQLATLAAGLLAGKPLTEAQWSGAGKPFSVEQFRNIRQEMQGAGLIRPKSEKDARQGFVLTPSGRAAMKRLAPSPDDRVGA